MPTSIWHLDAGLCMFVARNVGKGETMGMYYVVLVYTALSKQLQYGCPQGRDLALRVDFFQMRAMSFSFPGANQLGADQLCLIVAAVCTGLH